MAYPQGLLHRMGHAKEETAMDEELKRAALFLVPEYYKAVMALDMPVEDIRLRLGRPVSCCAAGREYFLRQLPVLTEKNLLWTLERATCSSIYSVQESLRQGYINASSGIRIGVCGTGVIKAGELSTIKDISSLSIRVARQCRGIAGAFLPYGADGKVENLLLISPPGYGKTSLLRDMVRQLSDRGARVAVADERGEIAAMNRGFPGFDIGLCTDVLEGVEKQEAVMMLLRTMAPQVVALDEISAPRDAYAVELAANNGAAILATVHGRNVEDIQARPALREILRRGIFRRALVIAMDARGRHYRQAELCVEGSHAA